MEDLHVLAQAQTNSANLHPGTPHDAEFERHHHTLHAIHSPSTRTDRTIPDEETLATYAAKTSLPTTQLRMMSTIHRRHVRFRQYLNHIRKIYHFNAHPLHQRDKIRTAITLQTRNIWSVLQNKPQHIGIDASAKNLLRPP